jgi:hypothetical protein
MGRRLMINKIMAFLTYKTALVTITLLLIFTYCNAIVLSLLASAQPPLQTKTISNVINNPHIKRAINNSMSNSCIVRTNKNNLSYIHILPPNILMTYSGTEYQGGLISYKYRGGETFSQLGIPPEKVKANLPSCLITVQKGSTVKFEIIGYPSVLPPSSLSVTAYSNTGKAVEVLTATQFSKSTFPVNLDKGKYILLAVAVWLPRSEKVAGYVMYNYPIKVTGT